MQQLPANGKRDFTQCHLFHGVLLFVPPPSR
jgi:hypothetical protein